MGGFGISAANDWLLIEDVRLVRQLCTPVTVQFDDGSVADYFDEHVDKGLPPERFARIWIHTHPGSCPEPSSTDEETFERYFGQADWALMFILARGLYGEQGSGVGVRGSGFRATHHSPLTPTAWPP